MTGGPLLAISDVLRWFFFLKSPNSGFLDCGNWGLGYDRGPLLAIFHVLWWFFEKARILVSNGTNIGSNIEVLQKKFD